MSKRSLRRMNIVGPRRTRRWHNTGGGPPTCGVNHGQGSGEAIGEDLSNLVHIIGRSSTQTEGSS